MNKKYIKIFAIIELIALLFFGLYYISCGESLYFRDSEGNIEVQGFDGNVGEIVDGGLVTQSFIANMNHIESIGIMVSNYARSDSDANVYVTVQDLTQDSLLAEKQFKVKDVIDYEYLDIEIPDGKVISLGDTIQIGIRSDAQPGIAMTVLYNSKYSLTSEMPKANEGFLYVNGEQYDGTMAIRVDGQDEMWLGKHFHQVVIVLLLFIALGYWILVLKNIKQGRSYFFSLFAIKDKYSFLIRQLVDREFKTRYKRSALGMLWSILNPLLMMSIQYIVFSHLFKSGISNFPVYLLSGTVIFNFFNEAVGQSMNSIVGNASLISKVYLPKYVYPITKVLSSGINLLLSLIPLFIAILITGEKITRAYLMIPYILICECLFTIGFGMMMAAAMTFFRDMGFLWGIISMAWTYLTPIFYPVSIIPPEMHTYYNINPMVHFVGAFRSIILDRLTPRPSELVICTLWGMGMLLIGAIVFKKSQDKFIFYV